jgi:hypothetical protein
MKVHPNMDCVLASSQFDLIGIILPLADGLEWCWFADGFDEVVSGIVGSLTRL